ncbi:MAG: Uma2 family endonuclease [Bryobacterales bacterium]|nr:Uma2 family endonuclease [Bryobacterales bacterium]
MASQPRPKLTEEQFLERERTAECKSEFVNGEVHAMSGGTVAHSLIKLNLYGELRNRLRNTSCLVFDSDLMVKVEATGLMTYPDVSVACGGQVPSKTSELMLLTPMVLIEVLSPTTEAWDRGGKWRHYQRIPSLQEYLLVSQHQPQVERFARRDDGRWLLDTYDHLDAEVPIDATGIRVPLHEIYRGVTFEQTAIS